MVNGFVQIEGIPGESSDEKHTGWIEMFDYDMDVGQTVSGTASSAGGASAERADFSEFCFAKLLDKASPKLALACAAGTHIDTIVVELCRTGGGKDRFMQYKFTNCMLTSYTISADGEFPEEEIAFFYCNVEWCYTLSKRTGGWSLGNVAAGWSLERNCRA